MKKKRPEIRDWDISFDMKNSHDFTVRARTIGEAKDRAFAKLQKIANKKSSYNIDWYKQ